jgi:CHAD domain-containing protein
MHHYARRQTALLMGRLAEALERAAKEVDEESIHDVRVAMRRLNRCLQVFAPFYPPGSAKKVRRRISALMSAAGAVRDCDIAIELMGRAGLPRRSAIVIELTAQRRKAGHELMRGIRRWKSRGQLHRWHKRLGL